jgi:hypothetical protein
LPGIQRFAERLLIDQPAARAIDDAHALLREPKRLLADDIAGALGEWRVQGDEVGAAEQIVEFDFFDTEIGRAFRR